MTHNELVMVVIGLALAFGLGVFAGVLLMRNRTRPAISRDEKIELLRAEVKGWETWYDHHMPKCRLLQLANDHCRELAQRHEAGIERAAREYDQGHGQGDSADIA